jgi:hypothetical protein
MTAIPNIGRRSGWLRPRQLLPALWLLAASLTAGCSGIELVSRYDEATDSALTALQQKSDDFIELLKATAGTADASFAKHQAFYDELDRDLRQLEFRVSSIPNNSHTTRLIVAVRQVLLGSGQCNAEGASLRDLHCLPANQATGPSPTALELSGRNINQTIGAALNLEIMKKQGLADSE